MRLFIEQLVWLIIFLIISWAVYDLVSIARAHEDHLEYIEEYIVPDSFNGQQFITVDNVCWEIYKSPHGDITSRTKLHVRKVECK